MLSVDDLRVYVGGPPKDDRTTTIQDSFIKLPESPEINNIVGLETYRSKVISFLKKETFNAFPKTSNFFVAPAGISIIGMTHPFCRMFSVLFLKETGD